MRNCGFDATIGSTASQTSFQLPMRPTSSHMRSPVSPTVSGRSATTFVRE